MVSEAIALIAVSGALLGAALNSIRSWYQAPEDVPFSWKNFGAALASSMLPALLTINFSQLTALANEGMVALFVTMALAGAGASTAFSQAHKRTVAAKK